MQKDELSLLFEYFYWVRDAPLARRVDRRSARRRAARRKAGLPLWYYGLHLFTHGLQQFSEAAVLLTRVGHSPGDFGFLEFANSRAR